MQAQKKNIKDFFSPTETVNRNASQNALLAQASSTTGSLSTLQSKDDGAGPIDRTSVDPEIEPLSLISDSPTTMASTAARAVNNETAPPNPSQNSVVSGVSKRAVSNGEQIVLNSESDSDSLPDLDWGEPQTTIKKLAPLMHQKPTSENANDVLRKPEKKGKNDKRSFNVLVKTAQLNMETERRILERKADLEATLEVAINHHVDLNEEILGQVIDGDDEDPDKAHRLFLAMQRTNATQVESFFHLFRDTSESIVVLPKFPIHCLPQHRWTCNFLDSVIRDQAFLSGFADQVFRLQELPEELASWMLYQLYSGPNEYLNTKYIELLQSHHNHITKLLDRSRLDTLLQTIGINVKDLDPNTELCQVPAAESGRIPPLPPSLKSIIRLLQFATPWLETKLRAHVIYILCHICLDDRVSTDADMVDAIRDVIEIDINSLIDDSKLSPELHNVVSSMLRRIKDPILQKSLVYALPARSLSAAYFQRYLALSFLLYPVSITVPITDPQVPVLLQQHLLQSPNFRITKDMNYSHLVARLTLLDIAIGPGLLPRPSQVVTGPAASQSASTKSQIKHFNDEIDALTRHIKLLGNSIVEAGAVVDLTILDAKDCIERLCSRLEHAVRIGRKEVHNVFDHHMESKQSRLKDFFLKAEKSSKSVFEDCREF